jgi:hypothetical protein
MEVRPPFLLVIAALMLAFVATSQADAAKRKPKPSIKAMGISINRVYVDRKSDRKVEANDDTNDCYILGGGASGVPAQLVAYAYVRGIRIPASAPMELEFKTPWDRMSGGAIDSIYKGTFGGGLFKAYKKPQAQIYGGPATKDDRFRYRMLPQPTPTSLYINGTYSISVSVKVAGKTLRTSTSVDVTC